MADSAYASIIRQGTLTNRELTSQLGWDLPKLIVNESACGPVPFGELVAQHAADDFATGRFHEHGQTVLDQLRPALPGTRNNVVANFLRLHRQALHAASQGSATDSNLSVILQDALEIESRAQGYLADAFAAGHILSSDGSLFNGLQRRNRIEAHNFHRDRGVYVINGRGDVWQTFGDGLLHWYPPTYQKVLEACQASLREVLFVYFVAHDRQLPAELQRWHRTFPHGQAVGTVVQMWVNNQNGDDYYATSWLPSLMLLPMPVTASWSQRTRETDDHGARLHHHYPQLREAGFHDPDLSDIDLDFLYSKESVPTWMIPQPLRRDEPFTPDSLLAFHPDWASVRWVQERSAPPSFKGLLLQVGSQATFSCDNTESGGSVGLGYGLWDDLVLFKNISVDLTFMPSFHHPNHRLGTITGGLGVVLPVNFWLNYLHIEAGLGVGLGQNFNEVGPVFGVGLDSQVIPFRFTNAGVTVRLMYQSFHLDRLLTGPSLKLIFQ